MLLIDGTFYVMSKYTFIEVVYGQGFIPVREPCEIGD